MLDFKKGQDSMMKTPRARIAFNANPCRRERERERENYGNRDPLLEGGGQKADFISLSQLLDATPIPPRWLP